jgi:hypothetical protein
MTTLGGAVGVACVPSQLTACLLDNNLSNNGPGGNGKSGYNFAAAGQGAAPASTFLTTGTPIGPTTGSKAYCATEDGVVRTAAVGVIAIVGTYANCQTLAPLAN